MCGICGVYGENAPEKTKTMIKSIRHRGPDGESYTNYPWGSLGFCWLDIFGPDTNRQPAISEEKNIALIFNGEIYNFEELKVLIRTKEVLDEATLILELFHLLGEKVFEKLKGMFAIAILTDHKLILARDSLGIKPLVYYIDNSKIYFASEIKALLQVYEKSPEINEDSLAESAVFGFVFNMEETMLKGIKQVIPGSYLVFENGNVTTNKYDTVKQSFYGDESWNKKESSLQFSKLMNESARLHLKHSKHDQAIYLSGGIDSTLMTYFLQNNYNKKISTYTLFDDEHSEDRLFANKVSSEFCTTHVEYKTCLDESLKFLQHYLYHYESLVTDGLFNVLGSLAFHILSFKIAGKHKVAYCGEGADELFGGYYWLQAHPLGVGDRLRAKSRKVNNGKTKINEYIVQHFPNVDTKEPEMRTEIFDFLMGPGLTNCHLWSVDRSSSAFSFEARPFYLYNDTINWALSLPINDKVASDRTTKLVLKKYAKDSNNELLAQISSRKKIGMPSALNITIKKLIDYSTANFNKSKNSNLPHLAYKSYLSTDLEKMMFDYFYDIFIIKRGKALIEL
jgi:asparagine synthase (glutamine-hydrolysing)